MQGHRGGMDPLFNFGGSFAGFGGFDTFRPPRTLRRDPFDDPFFTRPPGSIFQSTPFGLNGDLFPLHMHPLGFLEQQALEPRKSRGVIIEELNSDEENEDAEEEKKHARADNEPFVELPNEEVEEIRSTSSDGVNIFQFTPFGLSGNLSPLHMYPSGFLEHQAPDPQKSRGPIIEELNSDDEKEDAREDEKENRRKHARSENEPADERQYDEAERKRRNSAITYGGANGTYYTSSKTRRTGIDGVSFEECKEADSAKRPATPIISGGIHNKVTFEECKEADSAKRQAPHIISRVSATHS
ncbi:unnamed protein product [Sphenostylis stenocarpa]|uniref:Uncharacterized protein n=1 Tax=Sphenostylis stenocarpa TaxID=92480 RepID=A0AA86S6C8_9FABA|nr:unnamed protein product [Sphenostylis stenocarpa]